MAYLKSAEYMRDQAAESEKEADVTHDPDLRSILLALAQEWRRLAELTDVPTLH